MFSNILCLGICKVASPLALSASGLSYAQAFIEFDRVYTSKCIVRDGGRQLIEDLLTGKSLNAHRQVNGILACHEYCRFLIGMDVRELGVFMFEFEDDLRAAYPRSPFLETEPGWSSTTHDEFDVKSTTSVRTKVFLTLLRLRKGYTTREMAALFGWSVSCIQRLTTTMLKVMGIVVVGAWYAWPSPQQQRKASTCFERVIQLAFVEGEYAGYGSFF
jgi:hypothetical protein